MTGTGQDDSLGTAKKSKPAMEKRRRARINASLLELRDLIPESKQRLNKMEKADILEMTVKHLKRLQETNKTLEKNNPSSRSYSLGFDECTQEVSGFFRSSSPFSAELKHNLLNHLRKCAPHNPPDSPSSSPSKSAAATVSVATPTNSSSSSTSTTTHQTHAASSASPNTDNVNSNNTSTKVSCMNNTTTTSRKNLPVSIADSILSRCLLSTFPTTSSNINRQCLSTTSTTASSSSSGIKPSTSQQGQSIVITSERNNVSTPFAVSSTSDDPPFEHVKELPRGESFMELDRESSIEIIGLNNNNYYNFRDERSPSPTQIASTRILTMIKSAKAQKLNAAHNNDVSSAQTVKRDLLDAFREENNNNDNTDIATIISVNDANNNNSIPYQERDPLITKGCQEIQYVPIRSKPELPPSTAVERMQTYINGDAEHSETNINRNNIINTRISQNTDTLISNIPIMCRSHKDTAPQHAHNIVPASSCNNSVAHSRSNEIKTINSSVSLPKEILSSNRLVPILPKPQIVCHNDKIPFHSSQKTEECSPTCLIPVYIQTGENNSPPQTLFINQNPLISAKTQNFQQKGAPVFSTIDNEVPSSQLIPPETLCHESAAKLKSHNTSNEYSTPLVIDVSHSVAPTPQHNYFEDTRSNASDSAFNTEPSVPFLTAPCYNKLRNDSGYIEDDYEEDFTQSRFRNPLPQKAKKSPLSLRIEDGGSCCNSDDECHESGHITSDSARNSNERKEWVWGYVYDSDDYDYDDDDDNMSGPTLAKRIKSNSNVAALNSKDEANESSSRRNSFGKRCEAFRCRKGSLSQKMNLYKLKRDPLDPKTPLHHNSNESLTHQRIDGISQNVAPDMFRRRCFTFSQRPTRPIIPAMSTEWNNREPIVNDFISNVPKHTHQQNISENTNENGPLIPISRGDSNAREFLTARRRCATVSAKDLQRQRPLFSKRFMEPAGSVDSIPEDEGVCSVPSDSTNNNACTNARAFMGSPGSGDSVMRFRKRCSTFSSSRTSSVARELNLTRPSVLARNSNHNENPSIIIPSYCNAPRSSTTNVAEIKTNDSTDHMNSTLTADSSFEPPVKIFEDIALSEPNRSQEQLIPNCSNIQYVRVSKTSTTPILIKQHVVDSTLCLTNLNHSSVPKNPVVSLHPSTDINMNTRAVDIRNELTLDHVKSDATVTTRLPSFCPEQKPNNNTSFHFQESSPLNLSTKPRRNSAQNVFDIQSHTSLSTSSHRCSSVNNPKPLVANAQFPSTIKNLSENEEPYRPRSWSVSSGMSSLSLGGGLNMSRRVFQPRADDDDDNMWRPW